MATSGFTFGGLNLIGQRFLLLAADTQLVAYVNAPNSLGDTTVAADLSQPTVANGYAPITLTANRWTCTNGILTYNTGTGTGFPTWSATSTWSGTVNGTAIISGTTCIAFKDLTTPWSAALNLKLAIDLLTVL
jgi:hypothetical protein